MKKVMLKSVIQGTGKRFILLALLLVACGSSVAIAGNVYNFKLVNDGAVLVNGISSQTGYPSVIRIPDWVPTNERAHSTAVYYMYYGVHTGHYIRMKWAASLEGP